MDKSSLNKQKRYGGGSSDGYRSTTFFWKPRMLCPCQLEFLDKVAFERHMKKDHSAPKF